MGVYLLLHIVLIGFFAFGALHYFWQWCLARKERLLLAFAIQCALSAAWTACFVGLATATTIRTAQVALRGRITIGLLMMATLTWLVSRLTGVRARAFVTPVVLFGVGVATVSVFVVPLYGTVTEISRIHTWWGGTLSLPVSRQGPLWVAGLVYAVLLATCVFGVIAGASMGKRDRAGGSLVVLASSCLLVSSIAAGLVDVFRVRLPFLAAPGLAVMVGLFVMALSREYAARGAQVAASHRRWQAIFDQTFQFMELMHVDGTLLEINQSALAFAQRRAKDVTGRLCWETPWWSQTPALQNQLRTAVREAAGGQTVRFEATRVGPDDVLSYVDVSLKPVRDERGAVAWLILEGRDITERRQLEEQLRQLQKMDAIGQLAGGIAHDFNNLLTVINGTSELLLAQVSHDNPMHEDVQEIYHAGERAALLTRQLLAFSRQQILAPRVLDFNTVVTGMESLLRRLLGEDIDLVVVLTPGVGHVKADLGQIEQVITNLAVNARDAMPQGGQLTIETQNVKVDEAYARHTGVAMPPGSYIRLVVSDSGVGMDEVTRAHIFEPFFTTKGPGHGTGLGLSTVYGIVKQSQGFIWVGSEVGQGTSVKIYLPLLTEPASTDQSAPTLPTAGTETILIAEDNAGLRRLATRLLEPAGYTVLGAATGDEALRVLEHHQGPVHLLLSDVVMPGMSGRHLAERIAETHPGMKVLYMSGYTSDTVVRNGVLEVQMPFLNKPFTVKALLQKVREVLDS